MPTRLIAAAFLTAVVAGCGGTTIQEAGPGPDSSTTVLPVQATTAPPSSSAAPPTVGTTSSTAAPSTSTAAVVPSTTVTATTVPPDATTTVAPTTTVPPATTTVARRERRADEVAPVGQAGNGMSVAQPAAPLPEGYLEQEFFVAGRAEGYEADGAPDRAGFPSAVPTGEQDYRTRIVVRRPVDPEAFSGVVFVEWWNVTAGSDSSPDWAYLAAELGRQGHGYVGVSAQAIGIMGGTTRLGGPAVGLVQVDPERYGTLAHPGDAYSYDVFSQVADAVREPGWGLFPGPALVRRIVGMGTSQSAAYLVTYVNAVHPMVRVFDGFLVHGRPGGAAAIDGSWGLAGIQGSERIRTDLHEPVLTVQSETDLTVLGYWEARQPDTEYVRTWEVAGTAHADASMLTAGLGGRRDPSVGVVVGCEEPINAGPFAEVYRAASRRLVEWVERGVAPAPTDDLLLQPGGIARDEFGIAIGGVRSPLVDAPLDVLSGDPPGSGAMLCVLFGSTTPIQQSRLVERYGSSDGHLAAFEAAAADAIAAGVLLPEDGEVLLAEARSRELDW